MATNVNDTYPAGVLPAQIIQRMVESKNICSAVEIEESQIQPASLDLRLGSAAYRLQASFLPTAGELENKLNSFCLHTLSLSQGAVLEVGCVYLIPLMESLRLPKGITAWANPKSSTGRLDVFVRLLSTNGSQFDVVEEGYEGPLYIEVCPQTFPILVREGSRLNQLRFYRGGRQIVREIKLSAYLGEKADDLIGFRAKPHSGLVDVDKVAFYEHQAFWEPLYVRHNTPLILQPGAFYILRSEQNVCVSSTEAAEMVPYDPLVGEFRAHYAGFFDPSFGCLNNETYAVLEVRNHEMPFILDKGQVVARLVYEQLTEATQQGYGSKNTSSYCTQKLKLSKHFL